MTEKPFVRVSGFYILCCSSPLAGNMCTSKKKIENSKILWLNDG
uniref:Uncharacterized protein n=1 Tax=Anguilla anguilla TaxID=7936 RepID=A0A0E9UGF6_ANGAN